NRSSLSVADRSAGNLTEFYEHGPDAPEAAWAELLEAVNGLIRPGNWLTISGWMPRGLRDGGDRGLGGGGMGAVLRVGLGHEGEPLRLAVEAGPEIVKLNSSEASGLLGEPASGRDDALVAGANPLGPAGGGAHAGRVTA